MEDVVWLTSIRPQIAQKGEHFLLVQDLHSDNGEERMASGEGSTDHGEFLDVLYVGQCESLKAAVHAVLMGSVALCALYNSAAWLRRRQPHLGINAVLYTGAVIWEYFHVRQHLACRPPLEPERDQPLRVAA
jgi:hypothetical protein